MAFAVGTQWRNVEVTAWIQCELLSRSTHRLWKLGKGPGKDVNVLHKLNPWLSEYRFRTLK